jgi:hypothetical protein
MFLLPFAQQHALGQTAQQFSVMSVMLQSIMYMLSEFFVHSSGFAIVMISMSQF